MWMRDWEFQVSVFVFSDHGIMIKDAKFLFCAITKANTTIKLKTLKQLSEVSEPKNKKNKERNLQDRERKKEKTKLFWLVFLSLKWLATDTTQHKLQLLYVQHTIVTLSLSFSV